MELSDGLGDGEAELGATSPLIPIIIPDSFAAFAGWVTRWSNCPICYSWLETTGLSSAPAFGERRGFFFCNLDQRVFLCSGPRSLPQWTSESGQTCSSNPPCGTTFLAQATGTACPAKGPFGPSTPAAFLHPRPTSAPWSVPPLGSLHLGGQCCRRVLPKVSLCPDFRSLQSDWG